MDKLYDGTRIKDILINISDFEDEFNNVFQGIVEIDKKNKSIFYSFPCRSVNFDKHEVLKVLRKFISVISKYRGKCSQQMAFDLFVNKLNKLIRDAVINKYDALQISQLFVCILDKEIISWVFFPNEVTLRFFPRY